MLIEKILIKGLLGSEEVFSWSLGENVNILGGKNGSGKSTVLKICFQLLKYGRLIDDGLADRFESVEIWMTNNWCVCCEKRLVDIYRNVDGDLVPVLGEDGSQIKILRPRVTIKNDQLQEVSVEELTALTSVYMINSFEQNISDAIRLGKIKTEDGDTPGTFIDALIQEQMNIRNSNFAGAMEKLLSSIGKKGGANDIREDVGVQQYLQLYGPLSQFLKGYGLSLTNKLVFERNGRNIRYSEMSMGEKELLLILLTVANTNMAPCIMLLDEPDLSLHVDWKKMLITVLHSMNPDMQLIVTTHAPSMVRGWYGSVYTMNNLMEEAHGA